MYFALVLSHLGSLFLGVTLALAILFNASSRHQQLIGRLDSYRQRLHAQRGNECFTTASQPS
mgnify:CR=1 FL=1